MIGWISSWNKIIREVIWKDYDLKQLMKLPANTNILQFCNRYFICAGFTNELVTDEVCRIVYSDSDSSDTAVPNVRKSIMTFDIYVKEDQLHNVGDDRLTSRADLIAERIYKDLTQDRYLAETGYRFWIAGEFDLGTRTVGYVRKSISFYYMKVY